MNSNTKSGTCPPEPFPHAFPQLRRQERDEERVGAIGAGARDPLVLVLAAPREDLQREVTDCGHRLWLQIVVDRLWLQIVVTDCG